MLYKRTGSILVLERQFGEKKTTEDYLTTLQNEFPEMTTEVIGRIPRVKHKLTFPSIEQAMTAEKMIDDD